MSLNTLVLVKFPLSFKKANLTNVLWVTFISTEMARWVQLEGYWHTTIMGSRGQGTDVWTAGGDSGTQGVCGTRHVHICVVWDVRVIKGTGRFK